MNQHVLREYALQQYDYHVWANNKVCKYLRELSAEVYRKPITSVFPTIYDAMTHIYVIDCNWLMFLSAGGAMLRQLGYPGTPTDFGFYFYTLNH